MGKSNVYTRGGDKGETSLVSGDRILKSDDRIDLYGEVDELNSFIGLADSYLNEQLSEKFKLNRIIQSALFDLGSKLACEEEFWEKYKLPDINSELIGKIETAIDEMDSKLEKLKNFILPGGAKAASVLHICRTVCRRIERKLVAFQRNGNQVPNHSLEFMNRLSDYFFVQARYVNYLTKTEEIPWVANSSNPHDS